MRARSPPEVDAEIAATRTRAAIYRSLDLHLAYRQCDQGEYLLVNQAVDLKRVGGAIGPLRTRIQLA